MAILEKAAEAAAESWNAINGTPQPYASFPPDMKHMARSQARAVLIAVRDNSDDPILRDALNRVINEAPPADTPKLKLTGWRAKVLEWLSREEAAT